MDQTESPALTTKEAPAWPPLSRTALAIPVQPSPSRPIPVHPASSPVLGQPQPQKRPPAPQALPYVPDQLRYVPSALTPLPALECGLPRPRRPYLRRARPPLNSATSKSKLGSWRYQGLSRTGKDSEPRAATLLKTPFLSRPVPVRLRPPRRRSQLCPETPAVPWPGPHPAAPGVPSGVAADSRPRPQAGMARTPAAPAGRPDTGPLRPQGRLPTQPSRSVWCYRPQHSTSQEFHAVRASPTRRSLVTFPSM